MKPKLSTQKVLTQKELLKEVQNAVRGYAVHCEQRGIKGEVLKARVADFEKMIGMTANEFQSSRSRKIIAGELMDWIAFYNGYIAGVQYGQEMAATTLGVNPEKLKEATGK